MNIEKVSLSTTAALIAERDRVASDVSTPMMAMSAGAMIFSYSVFKSSVNSITHLCPIIKRFYALDFQESASSFLIIALWKIGERCSQVQLG